MPEVSATEFAKRYSRYRLAAQREPVAVTHHGRVTEVLMSKQDYDEYVRLRRLATRALKVEELSEEAIRALEGGGMDSRHGHLDSLMEG